MDCPVCLFLYLFIFFKRAIQIKDGEEKAHHKCARAGGMKRETRARARGPANRAANQVRVRDGVGHVDGGLNAPSRTEREHTHTHIDGDTPGMSVSRTFSLNLRLDR